MKYYVYSDGDAELLDEVADELIRLQTANEALCKALKMAIKQNDHDMLMTGYELRICEAVIAKAEGIDDTNNQYIP